MIFDDQAIAQLSNTLIAQGWTGDAAALDAMLSAQSAAASVRAFVQHLQGSARAHAVVTEMARQFSRVHFDAGSIRIALYMSNPDSDAEASLSIEYGKSLMTVRSRSTVEGGFAVEKIPLSEQPE